LLYPAELRNLLKLNCLSIKIKKATKMDGFFGMDRRLFGLPTLLIKTFIKPKSDLVIELASLF